MKAGRKKQLLTEKEAEIMNMLWDKGPLFIREMVELYPIPNHRLTQWLPTCALSREKDM